MPSDFRRDVALDNAVLYAVPRLPFHVSSAAALSDAALASIASCLACARFSSCCASQSRAAACSCGEGCGGGAGAPPFVSSTRSLGSGAGVRLLRSMLIMCVASRTAFARGPSLLRSRLSAHAAMCGAIICFIPLFVVRNLHGNVALLLIT